jgi:flavin reductase (DIM6/NTAB) family NADH-FMN oxidoreductase RutF
MDGSNAVDASRDHSVTAAEFRSLMSGFATGVAIVTALDRGGEPHGMTCTSLASVTVSPPMLLVCLDVRSGTLSALRSSSAFAVNLLHSGARRTAEVFSSTAPGRFTQVAWRHSETLRTPWLVDDAFTMAECRLTEIVNVGDHAIVLGQVAGIGGAPGVPLLYGMRQFSHWPVETPWSRP